MMVETQFELVVLGSGTCAATLERSMASYLLKIKETNRRVLLDIGAGSLRRLLEAGRITGTSMQSSSVIGIQITSRISYLFYGRLLILLDINDEAFYQFLVHVD